MTHTCPGCGFVSGLEARYCRMCGTPLPRAANVPGEGDGPVSPHADTVPLGGTTEDISPHDTASPASRAARDFEEFRRRADEMHARLEAGGPAAEQPRPPASGAAARAGGGADDEVTVTSVRKIGGADRPSPADPRRAADTGLLAAPRPATARHAGLHQTATGAPAAPGGATGNVERRALRLWLGLAVFGLVVVLCAAAAVVAVWYATRGGRSETPAAGSGGPAAANPADAPPRAPAAAEDAKRQAAARLAEAEQLLAAGRTDEAVARLREAASLDPSDAEPHRRLARLLLDGGARRTAIEELRAVLRIDSRDARAWRELARAQGSEGLHRDAAESYRRLFEVSDEARRDDRLQLARADALLRAGRDADARAAYERLASSRVAEVARASRNQLARITREEGAGGGESADAPPAPPDPASTGTGRDQSAGEREGERRGDSPARAADAADSGADRAPTPAAQLSPRERYERGVRLWQSNRAAAVADFAAAARAGNPDASYYLGLNLVEGRAVGSLRRGELVAALNYFGRARRGRHSAEARRREEELGREYDRRRAAGGNR
jgi:tetratricopeptide (TPR) repeat protein